MFYRIDHWLLPVGDLLAVGWGEDKRAVKFSVTRVGDFLHFGQLFKAFCNK